MNEITSNKDTIEGTAMDTKSGAAVKLIDSQIILIEGLDFWPEEFIGKIVLVTGILKLDNSIPKAGHPKNILVKQGINGSIRIIRNATWVTKDQNI